MKKNIVQISAFTILDDIAKGHNIKAADWAFTAWGDKQYSSRISELRKLQMQSVSGKSSEKIGRVLSVEKVRALFDGLKAIIEGETLKRELIEKLASVKTEREKNILLLLVAEEYDQRTIRLFLESLIGKSEK